MKTFTGWQYLLIDVANHWGLDKITFEERIQWAEDNLNDLEQLALDRGIWKEYPLYMAAVMAIREVQAGNPTGHMVGMDSVCSGMQLMSALTGCKAGAEATGMVDPDTRADAYTKLTELMSMELGYDYSNDRAKVKTACMTSLYGSKQEPINEFGEGTPELQAFYKSMVTLAPGACALLDALLASWQPYALSHEWTLPDGFRAKVKVMKKKQTRLEIDELGSSFTYTYYENEGERKAVKNAANIVHSIDSYVLRSLIRRCSYDAVTIDYIYPLLIAELLERKSGVYQTASEEMSYATEYYVKLYDNSQIADLVILEYLNPAQLAYLTDAHIEKLLKACNDCLEHQPFDVITIHDNFLCHPNNMNYLRNHYRQIVAGLADGDVLSHIFSEIHGKQGKYEKLSKNLGRFIEQSNYALS